MGWDRKHGAGLALVMAGVALSAQAPTDEAFLAKARAAYYSEPREGMARFRASLVPDWRQLLQEQKLTPEMLDKAVARLQAIRFTLVLDARGVPTIQHETLNPTSAQEAEALKQIYEGMEQMVTGFFQTWAVFMVSPPLPDPGTAVQIERVGAWQVVRYREGDDTRIEVTLGQDFAASEVRVLAKTFTSTIHPSFVKSPKGLVLTGYEATYRSGQAGESTNLAVTLQNQQLNGCTLPGRLDLRGEYGNALFHVVVTFADGQVDRK